jgi:hypothetical protein
MNELQVLLSRVMFFAGDGSDAGQDEVLGSYKDTADAVMCILLPESDTAAFRTEGELKWADEHSDFGRQMVQTDS